MFRHLCIHSLPVQAGWSRYWCLAMAAHGALITAALMTTGRVASSVRETRDVDVQHITYVIPRALKVIPIPRVATESPKATERAAKKDEQPAVPDFAAAQDAIDRAIEVPDVLSSESDLAE